MGEGALAWIGQIAEWFGQFIPRLRIVRATHCAVMWRRGKPILLSGPRLTIFWPLITEFDEYPLVRQGVGLREQTLVTMDDKTIVAGGMLVYEVDDPLKLIGETFLPDHTIREISLTALHDVCCQMTWSDLKSEQRRGTLDTKLKNAAQRALTPYGVKVLKLMLTDLSPCRVIRQVMSSAKGED